MSVGSVGGVGAGAGGAGAVGSAGSAGAAGAQGVGSAAPVDSAANTGKGGGNTKAVEQGGMVGGSQGLHGPQMSTQDFCALRTQAATPAQEAPEMDLQKMLQWLMAIKLLEAMSQDG